MRIHTLDAAACDDTLAQLTGLLLDAVAHGASLGFLSDLDADEARRYWQGVRAGVADGSRLLLAAIHEGRLAGTVQLDLCQKDNGRHRSKLQKMIVHSALRRRGIGSVLLRAAEAEARSLGRGLVHLDTEAGSGAEELVHGLGYTRVGELPDYARAPGGALRPTVIYYKTLLAPELA